MKILLAPDKFKGSLTAFEVATRLRHGMLSADASLDCVLLPLADGGDGSVDAALNAGYRAVEITVDGPTGTPRATSFALGAGTAIVEVASTCGISALPGGRREPLRTSSHGLGQAIRAALRERPDRIVVALGGSASTDGGIGMLAALGVVFRASDGTVLRADGASLDSIAAIDTSALVDLAGTTIIAASDVTNPLTGVTGAAAVFGPQKGATPDDVVRLDGALSALVGLLTRSGFADAPIFAATPGSGSAGGIGFACLLLGGTIVSGADFFLDLLGFDDLLVGCDLIVTGEGSLDDQTSSGKLVDVVARRSGVVPVIAVAGRVTIEAADILRLGLETAMALGDLTSAPTVGDPELTGRLLEEVGRRIVLERRTTDAGPPSGGLAAAGEA